MKKFLMAFAVVTVGLMANGNAQENQGSGTVTTTLKIDCSCTMGNSSLAFTNTVNNNVTSDWNDGGNLTFACSNGADYIVGAKRETGVGGSVQLVDANGLHVPYALTANGVNVPSTTLVNVQSGTTAGLTSFVNIPITINVAADAINNAEPSTYSNVATVEVYLANTGSCNTKSLYE